MNINNIRIGFVVILTAAIGLSTGAIAQDAKKSPLSLNLSYGLLNNKIPYVVATAKTKVEKKFMPATGVKLKVYLDKKDAGNLLGEITTNNKGMGSVAVSENQKNIWSSSSTHTFIAVAEKSEKFDETTADVASLPRTKITIDTSDDKNLRVTVTELKDGNWLPAQGVELKLGVKRLAADLPINDNESFTTDSTGHVTAEFKRLGMPGDMQGNIILVAKAEDNDKYGNLRVEKTVPWGVKFVDNGVHADRALWGGRFHSPIWLMFIAYSIVIGVWGTLIYLFASILKMRSLGLAEKKK